MSSSSSFSVAGLFAGIGGIAPNKKVREVEFIDEVPKSPTGKILRRELKDRSSS